MYTGLLTLALAGLAAAAPLEPRQNNACAVLAQQPNSIYKPSQVRACLKTVPFNQDGRANILQMIRAMYPLAIFQYNQIHDDSVLNQGIDIWAELSRIEKATYSSDFDFQQDISKIMYKLNDGHHGWQSCYDTFRNDHALPIVALSADHGSQTTITLAPDLPTYAGLVGWTARYRQLGIDTTYLAGATVNKINGRDVWDYLTNVAVPEAGTYQDPQQRLASLFASYSADGAGGYFYRVKGKFSSSRFLPEEDTISLSVTAKDGKTLDIAVPWYTRYTAPGGFAFSSGSNYYNSLCLNQVNLFNGIPEEGYTNATQISLSEVVGAAADVQRRKDEVYAGCPVVDGTANYWPLEAGKQPLNSAKYLGGRDIQFFKLDKSNVGVVHIPTFYPNGNSGDACRERFIIDAYLGVQNFTKLGVTKVLIDTTYNGGGYVALSQFLQRLFTGSKLLPQNNFDTRFAKSPLSEGIVRSYIRNRLRQYGGGSWAPYWLRKFATITRLSTSNNFFSPGDQFQVNGKTLHTSNSVSDAVESVIDDANFLSLGDAPPFKPEDIYFIGNGLCGSACASFTNHLIEYYNGKGYINTAQPGKPVEFAAFAAAQVYDSDSVYVEADYVGFRDRNLLPERKYFGVVRFAFRGGLSPNVAPGKYLQYRVFPAQNTYSLTQNEWSDPIANWEYVANQVF